MDHAVDKLAANARIQGRHQAEPQAREPRSKHGHGNHHAVQPALTRVLAQDVAVGHDVGATDFVDWTALDLEVLRRNQVIDYIADSDWLRLHRDPFRRDHHRQTFRQSAHHLERKAAGPNDNRSAEFDYLNA